jgi:hypothetical protein
LRKLSGKDDGLYLSMVFSFPFHLFGLILIQCKG